LKGRESFGKIWRLDRAGRETHCEGGEKGLGGWYSGREAGRRKSVKTGSSNWRPGFTSFITTKSLMAGHNSNSIGGEKEGGGNESIGRFERVPCNKRKSSLGKHSWAWEPSIKLPKRRKKKGVLKV